MLDSKIGGISSSVADGVRRATQVVQELQITGAGADRESRQLLAQVTAKLRTYRADTAVTLVMTRDGTVTELPMTLGDDGVYTAQVSLPPQSAAELIFAVTVDNDGTITREGETWASTRDLLPITMDSWGSGGYSLSGDQMELGGASVDFRNPATYETVQVRDAQFRLYRNGKLEQSRDGQVDAELLAQDQCTYVSDLNETGWDSLTIQAGDEIRVTVACTDETGLEYEFTMQDLTVEASGNSSGNGFYIHDAGVDAFPVLHWN